MRYPPGLRTLDCYEKRCNKSQYDSKGWLVLFQLAKFGKAFYLFDFAGFFPPQQYRTDRLLGGGLLALVFRKPKVGQSAKEPFDAQSGE